MKTVTNNDGSTTRQLIVGIPLGVLLNGGIAIFLLGINHLDPDPIGAIRKGLICITLIIIAAGIGLYKKRMVFIYSLVITTLLCLTFTLLLYGWIA